VDVKEKKPTGQNVFQEIDADGDKLLSKDEVRPRNKILN
jgi:hypothetical protein